MVVPVRGATLASSYSRTTFSLHMRCPGLYNGERALPLIEAVSIIPINFHLTGYAEVHGNAVIYFIPCGHVFRTNGGRAAVAVGAKHDGGVRTRIQKTGCF